MIKIIVKSILFALVGLTAFISGIIFYPQELARDGFNLWRMLMYLALPLALICLSALQWIKNKELYNATTLVALTGVVHAFMISRGVWAQGIFQTLAGNNIVQVMLLLLAALAVHLSERP